MPFFPFSLTPSRLFQLSSLLLWAVISASANVVLPSEEGNWQHFPSLLSGVQFDAKLDHQGQLVIFGNDTLELNAEGEVLDTDTFGETRQQPLDMPPAFSVDDAGGYHAVVRIGGTWNDGHNIYYRYRPAGGEWQSYIPVSDPVKRNYCVGVVGIDQDLAYVVVSEGGEDVWGDIHFYTIVSGAVTLEGSFSGIWRSDNRVQMERSGDWVYLAAGLNDPSGSAFIMGAQLGSDLYDRLKDSLTELKPASASDFRRGFPEITPAPDSAVDFVMGTQEGRLFWGRSTPQQSVTTNALKLIFDDLGEWHLSIGRGAAGTSDDGQVVVVVGIRSAGEAFGDGALVARVSYDGGATFGAEVQIYPNVAAGEGRTRLRVIPDGSTFFIVYAAENSIRLSRFDAYNEDLVSENFYLDGTDMVFLRKSEPGTVYGLFQFDSAWNSSRIGESQMGTGSHLIWRVPIGDGFLGYLKSGTGEP